MADIDDLIRRHKVESAGCMYFGGSVCCWVNREAPTIHLHKCNGAIPEKDVLLGDSGWRVGWAPTLPEAFMLALMSQRVEEAALSGKDSPNE